MPGSDLAPPPTQGSAQGPNPDGTRVVLEVPPEPVDILFGEVGVRVGVDLSNDLCGVPRRLGLAPRVAGCL